MENEGNIIREFGTNYTCIPSDIFHDDRVSLKARGLYATCMGFPKDWTLSVKGLQSILKEGRDAIYAALKELRKYGYLEARQGNNGRFGTVVYVFKPSSDSKPVTEKPHTENPNTENPTQYNNISNTLYNNIEKENKKKSLEERQKEFYETIVPYVEKYGKEMCRDFYNYWTEPFVNNKNKMRFEAQKTWSIGGRLATWNRNNSNYGTRNNYSSKSAQRECQEIARRAEILQSISANHAACSENIGEIPDVLDF